MSKLTSPMIRMERLVILVDGIDVFAWWVTQDVEFQQNIVMQFMWIMAKEIMSGTAE
jgi:hypothetical protein